MGPTSASCRQPRRSPDRIPIHKRSLWTAGVLKQAQHRVSRLKAGVMRYFTKTESRADLDLAAFAAADLHSDCDGNWMKAPPGTYLLGLQAFGTQLYTRRAYEALAAKLEQLRDSKHKLFVLSGSKGVGKTAFLIWNVMRLRKQGRPVIYHAGQDLILWYSDKGVSELTRAQAAKVLSNRTDVTYLVDDNRPVLPLQLVAHMVVLACSPDQTVLIEEVHNNWQACQDILYMPPLTPEELDELRNVLFPNLTSEEIPERMNADFKRQHMLAQDKDSSTGAVIDLHVLLSTLATSPGYSNHVGVIEVPNWETGDFFRYSKRFLTPMATTC